MKKYILLIIFSYFLICPQVQAETVSVKLKKCVDGDTARFIINNQEKSTRFLAINTPELKHGNQKEEPYGKEASNYTCKKLKNAKKITLEFDKNSSSEDKYGRVLAWVFVDDELLQNTLVKYGYAEVAYLYGDYKYTSLLKKSQKLAQKEKLKIWSNNKEITSDNLVDEILDRLFNYIRKEIKSML